MQPVTIKNKQLYNTLWLIQPVLLLLLAAVFYLGFVVNLLVLLLVPLVITGLVKNLQAINSQSELCLMMRSNGSLLLSSLDKMGINAENSDGAGDISQAAVNTYWFLPHVLWLKLAVPSIKEPVHIMLIRPIIGAKKFSQLLVGITQNKEQLE